MTSPNFSATLLVDQSPEEVFRAVTDMRAWWSENIVGPTEKLGEEFTYSYQDVHRTTMKLVELVPNARVVWLVTANHFNFIEDETEWVGTKVIFDISRKRNQTEIRFTHQGLVPEYECFGVCSSAWGSYIHGSLKNLLTTGKGNPNPKE